MKTCIFCNTTSDMIGLEGLKSHEAYCPFCCKTQKEYIIKRIKLMTKSCMECMNLKVKKVDGSFRVGCKERGIKQKFFDKLEEIGTNNIDLATYTVAASKCVSYDPDII